LDPSAVRAVQVRQQTSMAVFIGAAE